MFFTVITSIVHFLYSLVLISYSLYILSVEDSRMVIDSIYLFNFLTRERFKLLTIFLMNNYCWAVYCHTIYSVVQTEVQSLDSVYF